MPKNCFYYRQVGVKSKFFMGQSLASWKKAVYALGTYNLNQPARGKTMTKADVVKNLKEQAGLATLAQAEAAYEKLFALIGASLKKGEAVSISGFGSFKLVDRKARTGRNPSTGEEVQIPARKVVKFTPGKALKESV
jgi:DNA-binding protein HU-beta